MDRITTAEAATLLKCTTGRVRQLVGEKTLKPVGKIGQTYIFKRAAIDKYRNREKNGRK